MGEDQLQLDDNRLQQEVARSKIAAMPLHNFINVLRGRYQFSTSSICASLIVVNAQNLPENQQEQGLTTATAKKGVTIPKSNDPAIIEQEEKNMTEKALYFESLEIQRAKDPKIGQEIYNILQKKDITPLEIQQINTSLASVPITLPQPLYNAIITRQATSSTILFSPEENLIMDTAIKTNIKSKNQISQQTHAHILSQHHAALMDNPRQSLELQNLLATTPERKDLPTNIQEELHKSGKGEKYDKGTHEKRVSILAEIIPKLIGARVAQLAAAGTLLNAPNALTKAGMGMKQPINPEGSLQKDKGTNGKIKEWKPPLEAGSQQPPPQQSQQIQTQDEQTTEETDETSGEQTTTTTTKEKSFFNSAVKSAIGGLVGASALGTAGLGGCAYWSATQATQNPDVPKTVSMIIKVTGVIFSRFFSSL
jgi:hypothetical protein